MVMALDWAFATQRNPAMCGGLFRRRVVACFGAHSVVAMPIEESTDGVVRRWIGRPGSS